MPSATHQPNSRITCQRLLVALGRGPGDVLAPHVLGVAAGQLDHARPPPGVGRLAGEPAEPAARRVALPATAPAARARRAVRVDDHVAGLAGEPVGAPLEHAARDDAAADPGAQRDEHDVGRALGRAPLGRSPQVRAGGVVVDDDRQAEAARAASSARRDVDHARQVRCRSAARPSGRPARARPADADTSPASLDPGPGHELGRQLDQRARSPRRCPSGCRHRVRSRQWTLPRHPPGRARRRGASSRRGRVRTEAMSPPAVSRGPSPRSRQ